MRKAPHFQEQEQTFDLFDGVNTTFNPSDIPQPGHRDWDGKLQLAQADNVYSPNDQRYLITRPGMTDIRATAVSATGIYTGGVHMGAIADEVITSISISGTSHNFYRDNANPNGAIAGGTNLTQGGTNLVDFILFTDGTNPGAIAMSRLRDTPQFFVAATTRSDFSITSTLLPAFGEVFRSRAVYGAPSVSGTVYDDRYYWSDLRNGKTITDITTQWDSVDTKEKDSLRALRRFGEVLFAGKLNNVFLIAANPAARTPFAQREIPAGLYKGPVSQQGTVMADEELFWMGQRNIHSLTPDGRIKDWGDSIRSTIETGLDDTNRQYTVAGYDAQRDLVLFAVTNSGDTINKRVIAVNVKTGAVFPNWTLNINAMFQRLVSGDNRLIVGGYVGLFRNWGTGTTGNADSQTGIIGADIFTPRHDMGYKDWVKLFLGVKVKFKPSGNSEAVTLNYRMDDASVWSPFAESAYTVTGTANDENIKYFGLGKVGTHCQLEFKDAVSGDVMQIQSYSIVYKILHPGFAH